jgi:hypothetical protein
MGDSPLISTFHDSLWRRTSNGYQRETMIPGIRNCIPQKGSPNVGGRGAIAH